MNDTTLTPRERALIRNEFMMRFAQVPRLKNGILVKRWATGPSKGQPKPGSVIQGMLDRGLLELRDDGAHWLRARFTEAGLGALRHMAEDPRALPPSEFQHILDELGPAQPADHNGASSGMARRPSLEGERKIDRAYVLYTSVA